MLKENIRDTRHAFANLVTAQFGISWNGSSDYLTEQLLIQLVDAVLDEAAQLADQHSNAENWQEVILARNIAEAIRAMKVSQ